MQVNYYIDGMNLRTLYDVFVSKSIGLLSKPKPKQPKSMQWQDYHGEVVDLGVKYYESREIQLECFTKAGSNAEMIKNFNHFMGIFDKSGTHRLSVSVDSSEPLVYEVFLGSSIDLKKTWSGGQAVGEFTLVLREPEPVKKVLKHTRTGDGNKTVSITVTSSKLLNIYWGDGTHTFDVSGADHTVTHDYTKNGTFYIVITGNIGEITSLTTTGRIVWNKL